MSALFAAPELPSFDRWRIPIGTVEIDPDRAALGRSAIAHAVSRSRR